MRRVRKERGAELAEEISQRNGEGVQKVGLPKKHLAQDCRKMGGLRPTLLRSPAKETAKVFRRLACPRSTSPKTVKRWGACGRPC